MDDPRLSRAIADGNAGTPAAAPRGRRRVLLLTHRLPYPPDRGDRIRSWHLLRALSQRYDVTLASVCEAPPTLGQLRALQAHAGDVLFQRIKPAGQRCRAALGLALGRAGTPAAHFHRGLARRLADLHRAEPFDTVVTFCTGMAGYAAALRDAGGAPFRHVLDLVDVDSLKWARYARDTVGPMRQVYAVEARRLRRVESGGSVPIDALSVISEHEQRVYRRTAARVGSGLTSIVAGNGVDTDYFAPNPAEQEGNAGPSCVFTGVLSYRPNVEALAWFARDVWPRVRAAVPGARFDIVGKSPAAAVLGLCQLPGVRVVGEVPDTRPWLRGAALAVAPLRIAPGVQNKVLEAMACATPVVCTPAAARGIDARAGRDLFVADDAPAFAASVAVLLRDSGYARRVGAAARRRVEQRYTWAETLAPLITLIDGQPITTPVTTETTRRPPARHAA